jgi:F-type H+-transporting ATPase subunit b
MPQFEQIEVFQSLIFWSVISFAILFFFLKKFAFPPILAALDEREIKIRGDIEESEKLKQDVEEIKLSLEKKLKAAHEKAETIVQLAQDESKKLQEKTVQETEAKVKQVQREAEQEIESSRNKLLQEILSYTAALTIASAEKFLKKSLDDNDKKRLADESIEKVARELKI